MNIEKAKELCEEHNTLSKTVKLIDEASKANYWVAIKTPKGESYLSNNQIRIILADTRERIDEIEKTLKSV